MSERKTRPDAMSIPGVQTAIDVLNGALNDPAPITMTLGEASSAGSRIRVTLAILRGDVVVDSVRFEVRPTREGGNDERPFDAR